MTWRSSSGRHCLVELEGEGEDDAAEERAQDVAGAQGAEVGAGESRPSLERFQDTEVTGSVDCSEQRGTCTFKFELMGGQSRVVIVERTSVSRDKGRVWGRVSDTERTCVSHYCARDDGIHRPAELLHLPDQQPAH